MPRYKATTGPARGCALPNRPGEDAVGLGPEFDMPVLVFAAGVAVTFAGKALKLIER